MVKLALCTKYFILYREALLHVHPAVTSTYDLYYTPLFRATGGDYFRVNLNGEIFKRRVTTKKAALPRNTLVCKVPAR